MRRGAASSPPPRKTAPKVEEPPPRSAGDRLAPLVLTAKNIQALRTLHVAHRLAETTGRARVGPGRGALLARSARWPPPDDDGASRRRWGPGRRRSAASAGRCGSRWTRSDGEGAVLGIAAAERALGRPVRNEDDNARDAAEGPAVGVEELEAATVARTPPLGRAHHGAAASRRRRGDDGAGRIVVAAPAHRAGTARVDVSLMNARRAGTLLWPAFEAHVVGAAAAETDPEVLSGGVRAARAVHRRDARKGGGGGRGGATSPRRRARRWSRRAGAAEARRAAARPRDSADVGATARPARAATRERGERVKSAGVGTHSARRRPAKDASGARVAALPRRRTSGGRVAGGKNKKKIDEKTNRIRARLTAAVQLGWSALAAVASDLLPAGAVPSSRRARLVAAIFAYVEQTDDLNAALSAVGALWTVADQSAAARRRGACGEEPGKISSRRRARHRPPRSSHFATRAWTRGRRFATAP